MALVHRPSSADTLTFVQIVGLEYIPIGIHLFWPRWIIASINDHFSKNRGALPLYLEGDERTLQDEAEFYELRVDGPFILQVLKNQFFIDIEINVLVQTHMDDKKLYNMQNAIGPMAEAMSNTICVYKLGDGILDDGSLLGTLHLKRNLDETVDINQFGIIKEDTRITQATVEGHYRMESP